MKHTPKVRQRYLFLDDEFIAEQKGLTRKMGKPVRHEGNPILRPDRPWEGMCVLIWGSVIWDDADNMWRMWYEAYNPHNRANSDKTLLCYAESQDGVNWVKPNLGLVAYDGDKNNNIVFRATERFDTATVVVDPFDPPASRRYKMMLFNTATWQFLRYGSPDGLHWEELGAVNNVENLGDRHSLMIDREAGRWNLYYKQNTPLRVIRLATSEDFEHWTDHGEVLTPDENDPPDTQFYGMVGFRHGCFGLGFLEIFDIRHRRLYTQLTRLDADGKPSRYMQGEPFLNYGELNTWESTWVFPGNCEPIRYGEEIRIYYQGRSTLHWAGEPDGRGHTGAIGLARLRPDGYVYMEAESKGMLMTPPVEVTGHFIDVNADASAGSIRVELLDESGAPLEGFEADACCPIDTNATYSKLIWGGRSGLDELVGRKVRLKFHMDKARLYSFWFSDMHY